MAGWNPNDVMAFASVVNVVLVFVLAAFNYRYMRSAAEQAAAAREQAAAALENIKILKNQVREQNALRLTEALVDFRRLDHLIRWWMPRLDSEWGAISSFPSLLPQNWPSMFHIVEQTVPEGNTDLLKIESHVRNAETIMSEALSRNPTYRNASVFKAAANDLSEAGTALRSVLDELELAFDRRSSPTVDSPLGPLG